jgi:hypothetical protein
VKFTRSLELVCLLKFYYLNGLPKNGRGELGSREEEERRLEDEASGARIVPRELAQLAGGAGGGELLHLFFRLSHQLFLSFQSLIPS